MLLWWMMMNDDDDDDDDDDDEIYSENGGYRWKHENYRYVFGLDSLDCLGPHVCPRGWILAANH